MKMDPNQLPSSIPAPHFRPFTEASGFLFHRNSLIVSGGILLLSAWEGFVALVVLLGLILGAAVLSKIWTRLSLVRVSCKRTVRERRLFPGDQTELSLEVANRKPVPLPWIEIEDAIPPELVDENLPPSPGGRTAVPCFVLLRCWGTGGQDGNFRCEPEKEDSILSGLSASGPAISSASIAG